MIIIIINSVAESQESKFLATQLDLFSFLKFSLLLFAHSVKVGGDDDDDKMEQNNFVFLLFMFVFVVTLSLLSSQSTLCFVFLDAIAFEAKQ